MSNSKLVTYTKLSPNHSGKRTHKIDRITPHCVVGQFTAAGIAACFVSPARGASCNYGIGTKGDIALIVNEANRSWCSSSKSNDQRAVTIECASDKVHPYTMNNKVWKALIKLCVDICKRNGKTKLLWLGTKAKTEAYSPKSNEMVLSIHRWYAAKACPGDWLVNRLSKLASEVTKQLGGSSAASKTTKKEFKVKVTIKDLWIRKGAGTNTAKISYIKPGTYTIVETKSGPGSSAGWGKLKSGAGWISLDFAKKV